MSSVLATNFTKSMMKRSGYITLQSTMKNGGSVGIMDDDFMYYTFKDCLKIDSTDFHKWICYWDDCPFAIVCDVKADKLANGFTKVAVLSKTVVQVSEIGEYPVKRNHCFGSILNGKFLTNKGMQNFVTDNINNADIMMTPSKAKTQSVQKKEKTVLSNTELKNLKQEIERNWGITLK